MALFNDKKIKALEGLVEALQKQNESLKNQIKASDELLDEYRKAYKYLKATVAEQREIINKII